MNSVREQEYETIQFAFLGYTFRPRRSKGRNGCLFVNFSPAISRSAAKSIRQTMRRWRLQLKSDKTIEDLARMFRPVIQGWINYYCKYYPSAFQPIANHLDRFLVRWVMRKFKRFRGHQCRTLHWLGQIAKRQQYLFPDWRAGFVPPTGTLGTR
jgi:RNA-directed DNA polymerase